VPPVDPIRAPGTPESAWRAWPGLAGLPVADPLAALARTPLSDGPAPTGPPGRGTARRVLVVAAHPDDEVLGFGGTLAVLAAARVRLRLVSVTDGEASHPRSGTAVARDLAAVRTRELRQALGRLGADVRSVTLGMPDGRVARHDRALTGELTALLDGCDLCVAPFRRDLHPDHDAVGRAALAAGTARGVPVWEYPVWAWHWAAPGDPRLPWHRAARIPLPPTAVARKNEALECFRSQIHPLGDGPGDEAILPPADLDHFRRDFEVVWR
jgi:LmbE family N-acetylglucosaminyl deacetylase